MLRLQGVTGYIKPGSVGLVPYFINQHQSMLPRCWRSCVVGFSHLPHWSADACVAYPVRNDARLNESHSLPLFLRCWCCFARCVGIVACAIIRHDGVRAGRSGRRDSASSWDSTTGHRPRARTTCSPPGGSSWSGWLTRGPSSWSSRTCSGQTPTARLRRLPARVVAQPSHLRARLDPSGAGRAPPHVGSGRRKFSSLYLEPLGAEAMNSLSTGWCPACRLR